MPSYLRDRKWPEPGIAYVSAHGVQIRIERAWPTYRRAVLNVAAWLCGKRL